MPGLYTEPTSRAQADATTRAATSTRSNGDRPNETGALSYDLPVQLPERPEPDRGHRPRGRDRRGPRSRRASNRHGIPNLGACIRCNVQLEGSGVSADDVVIDAGDAAKGNGGPNGVGLEEGRGDPRRPRRRLRAAQRDRPPRQGARHLRARDRRLPARPLQGVLQRALRHADLRRRPRRPAELRGGRPRRLRHLPGRRARDRAPAARGHAVPLQPGDPAAATCTTTSRATRGRTATPSTCTTTRSTTTRSASRPTS